MPLPLLLDSRVQYPLSPDHAHAQFVPVPLQAVPDPRPPQDPKEQRRHSIESLKLAPIPDDDIRIKVESDGIQQQFTLHRQLLCLFSPYFRKFFEERKTISKSTIVPAFTYVNELDFEQRGEYVQATEKELGEVTLNIKVNLPTPTVYHDFNLPKDLGEVKRAVFASFIVWLYRAFPGEEFPPPDVTMETATLIKLWVLAGRLGVPSCQNDCIVAIERRRQKTNVIETAMIRWAYENTRDYPRGTCGLRNLLVDQCAWVLDEGWLLDAVEGRANSDQFPRECLVDIVARLRVLIRLGINGPEPLADIGQKKSRYWANEDKIVS